VESGSRSDAATPWVHIGLGNFARGHAALLAQHADLAMTGVNLHSRTVRDALEAQDGLYHVVTRGRRGFQVDAVRSVRSVLVAREDPARVVDVLARKETELVTLTIMQPAYHYDPDRGLDVDHAEIADCLAHPESPTSAIGFLVAGLARRYHAGEKPFVAMSLDNFVGNGDILRRAVLAYADHRGDAALRRWIAETVLFPNTMVDRIVPCPTPELENWLAGKRPDVAAIDRVPIFAEPWPRHALIVSGHGRVPVLRRLERAGVSLVDDVSPYSLMKVRMLNGAHLMLGMAGQLAGYTESAEAMADPAIERLIRSFLSEIRSTLPSIRGVDYNDYTNEIVGRLGNPALPDKLSRLSRNSYDKMPQRVFEPLQESLARGMPRKALMTAVAVWATYMHAARDGRFKIEDAAAKMRGLLTLAPDDYGNAVALIGQVPGLPKSLSADPRFAGELQKAMEGLPQLIHGAGAQMSTGAGVRPPLVPLGASLEGR